MVWRTRVQSYLVRFHFSWICLFNDQGSARKQRWKWKKREAQKSVKNRKRKALEALGFACLMTRVQALERTRDRLNRLQRGWQTFSNKCRHFFVKDRPQTGIHHHHRHSPTPVRDIKMMFTRLWKRPFRGHLIITPTFGKYAPNCKFWDKNSSSW